MGKNTKILAILAGLILFCGYLLPETGPQEPVFQGKVLEKLSFSSALLNKELHYSIYLPPDYDTSKRGYPVVYLLHGYSDDDTAWIQFGEVHLTINKGIASREIPPMIIIMPDAGVSWYINDHKGEYPYEDMFFQEFIPFIDTAYRTRPEKEFRGISGLSMGGYGALGYAMRHPEFFSACAAFSSGLMTDDTLVSMEERNYNGLFSFLFGQNLTGSARLTSHWKQTNPLDLAKNIDPKILKSIRWYIDCGDDDFLYKGNAALHITLREREIPHEYRVRDGEHNWTYWRTWISEGLNFIGSRFHR
ncbi:MAG: esterase family protein [Candidatus Aminicenantes bacterium]|nr:esterase family protein [Candidatus Aminicenantes bacterium]